MFQVQHPAPTFSGTLAGVAFDGGRARVASVHKAASLAQFGCTYEAEGPATTPSDGHTVPAAPPPDPPAEPHPAPRRRRPLTDDTPSDL